MKLALLIIEAVILVVRYLRDQEAKGADAAEALKELKSALSKRIDAAVDARARPDDPGVPDPLDRR